MHTILRSAVGLAALVFTGCGAVEGWQSTAEMVETALVGECAFVGEYEYTLFGGNCPGAEGTFSEDDAAAESCTIHTTWLGERRGDGSLSCDPDMTSCDGDWTEGDCTWQLHIEPLA